MTSSSLRACAALALAAVVMTGGCKTGEATRPSVDGSVAKLTIDILGPTSLRIRWPADPATSSYRLERRADRVGDFAPIADNLGRTAVSYDDTGLTAKTTYGYRLIYLDAFGKAVNTSPIIGGTTPPLPGILVGTQSVPIEVADTNGYRLTIVGAGDSITRSIGANGSSLFSPLKPGVYTVRLADVAVNCTPKDSLVRQLTVTDQGSATQVSTEFDITCRDPKRGRAAVTLRTAGDSIDPNGYRVRIAGVADSAGVAVTPPTQSLPAAGGVVAFDNLLPGRYSAYLEDVAAVCTVVPASKQVDFTITPLQSVALAFDATCAGADAASRPYVWRSSWSSAQAPAGSRISLTTQLDLTAGPARYLSAFTVRVGYDPLVLRADSVRRTTAWDLFSTNITTAGTAQISGASVDQAATGLVNVARVWFTVIGPSGATTTTNTTLTTLATRLQPANVDDPFVQLTRKSEATFTVGAGSGGGGSQNQAPTARAGGPYSGAAGAPVAFSAAASSDPDGTIAGYAWTFGDGVTGTGVSPTHAYTAAGTYPVGVTVTDNGGATATATTQATISASGAPNQAPVARAGGPYSGTAGAPIAFNGSASSDADGTVATYAWAFGDGTTGTGASPSHTYAAGGTYSATLTVTDNAGATGSASATVTVAAGGGGGASGQFVWANVFGTPNTSDSIVTLTVTMDLSQGAATDSLKEWVVDSLKWDPTVLRYFAFNFNSLGSGTANVNSSAAVSAGRLAFRGQVDPTLSTGVVPIATIRFKVIGARGRAATTTTALSAVTGSGFTSLRSRTTVTESTLTVP